MAGLREMGSYVDPGISEISERVKRFLFWIIRFANLINPLLTVGSESTGLNSDPL